MSPGATWNSYAIVALVRSLFSASRYLWGRYWKGPVQFSALLFPAGDCPVGLLLEHRRDKEQAVPGHLEVRVELDFLLARLDLVVRLL